MPASCSIPSGTDGHLPITCWRPGPDAPADAILELSTPRGSGFLVSGKAPGTFRLRDAAGLPIAARPAQANTLPPPPAGPAPDDDPDYPSRAEAGRALLALLAEETRPPDRST